jgi:hypothetical protein
MCVYNERVGIIPVINDQSPNRPLKLNYTLSAVPLQRLYGGMTSFANLTSRLASLQLYTAITNRQSGSSLRQPNDFKLSLSTLTYISSGYAKQSREEK